MSDVLKTDERLRALEDLEAIRALKARYFFCCDQKDPSGMRECFAAGEVLIDYGRVGVFSDRDKLVEVFERLGCAQHIVEMHHGVNPQITLIGDGRARGSWGLHYQQINTRDGTLTQLGATYDDEYRKIDGAWKIAGTRCVVTSTLLLNLVDGALKTVFAGRAPVMEAAA
jgi:hypothetical protein